MGSRAGQKAFVHSHKGESTPPWSPVPTNGARRPDWIVQGGCTGVAASDVGSLGRAAVLPMNRTLEGGRLVPRRRVF